MRALEYFAPDPSGIPPEIAQYLAERRRTGAAPSTVYAYSRDLRDFATFAEETLSVPFAVSAVTAELVLDYKAYLRVRRLAARTINRRLAAIKGFSRYAVAAGWISSDPARSVPVVRTPAGQPKSLPPEERQRLLAVLGRSGTARDVAMVMTMLHCGLRISEVCALRTDALVLTRGQESVLVRQAKGDRDRVVPVNDAAREALCAYLALRPRSRDDHVFLGQRGEGLAANTVQLRLRRLGQLAQIADLTAHRLRHTFARDLLAAGVDITTVAHLLGHASIVTTQVYTQPSAEEMRAAVAKLAGRRT